MKGMITITYIVLCESDMQKDIGLGEILKSEKIEKAIKSEYGKGLRNLVLSSEDIKAVIRLATQKKTYQCEIEKDDFADALTLAEEDARRRKLVRKTCERIELVDIKTK